MRIAKIRATRSTMRRPADVETGLPGGPVPYHGIFLERFHGGVAPALEVIVGGVELANVVEAEQVILAFPASPSGSPVRPCALTALPLASWTGMLNRGFVRRLGTHRVEIF